MQKQTSRPLVTVITPTTGNPKLREALESVASQSYANIQHLVVIDGLERSTAAKAVIAQRPIDVIELPYATGKDRFNGHLIYGAATFLAKGELICFLDEDNWMDREHVKSLVAVLRAGNEWAFSLRNIVDQEGQLICPDNCESLGKWPSILSPKDYLVDVSCFLLPKELAVKLAPIWNRKTREPGVTEVDRMLTQVLRDRTRRFDSNYLYSLNYRAGSTGISVKANFFIEGNRKMAQKFSGRFPWDPLRQKLQAK
ncbi:MAG: glycosyltransferase family 2 protein [Hyphomicrobiaceae bacterium]